MTRLVNQPQGFTNRAHFYARHERPLWRDLFAEQSAQTLLDLAPRAALSRPVVIQREALRELCAGALRTQERTH
jgi:hypothetical protein